MDCVTVTEGGLVKARHINTICPLIVLALLILLERLILISIWSWRFHDITVMWPRCVRRSGSHPSWASADLTREFRTHAMPF